MVENLKVTMMDESINPFLPEGQGTNQFSDYTNMVIPPPRGTEDVHEETQLRQPSSDQPVSSTPIKNSNDSSNPMIQGPTYILPNTHYNVTFSDKIIKKFSGYMHEDGTKCLREFESYSILSNIVSDTDPERAVAAFHLHLQGPSLTWFVNLSKYVKLSDKSSWTLVKYAFSAEYCDLDNDPKYISESAAFDNLTLGTTQPLEEFHSVVYERGHKLQKSERDIIAKFIQGLPSQLAFFVRARRVNTFREALHSAKIGEAHGYRDHSRSHNVGSVAPPQTSKDTNNSIPREQKQTYPRSTLNAKTKGKILSNPPPWV